MTPNRTGSTRRAALSSATAPSFGPAHAALAGLLLGAAAAPVLAQTAVPGTAAQGYAIYQNGTGGKPACASCHGPDPTAPAAMGIQAYGAGNPAAILDAWGMPPMNALNFSSAIDFTGRVGLGNYLAFPAAGTAPFSIFSMSQVTFGSVIVGQNSTQTVTLSNIGAAAITGLALQPLPSAAGVTETTDCGATLASGASCSINVTFAPSTSGAVSGGYVASSNNDANTAHTLFISATGTAASAPAASSGGGGGIGWLGLAGLLAAAGARRGRSRQSE